MPQAPSQSLLQGKSLTAFFVYGTLKRHQCRQDCWPRAPLQIQPAFVRGCLYDLDEYPALTSGDDWVGGELWWFESDDAPVVRAQLDQIEVFNQPGQANLYLRSNIVCFESPGDAQAICLAEVYLLADPSVLTASQRIVGSAQQAAMWPRIG